MEQFQCRVLEVKLRIQQNVFAKSAFLDDVKDVLIEEREIYAWSFGSKTNPQKQHAHLVVDFHQDDFVTAIITYHYGDLEIEDIRPPYTEDCAQWLAGFIQTEKTIANLRALYGFDEVYAPKISLPFPLLNVMEETELTGAVVTGVAIRFQPPSEIERVIVERLARETMVSIYSTQEVTLREFSVEQALQGFVPLIKSLIRERESV